MPKKTATLPPRVALVIGNSAYKNSPLKNPVNDAKAMSAKLKILGFEVIERQNLGRKQVSAVLREFRSKLKPGAVALFFYAGHGLQVKGVNYLPAVDAEIESEEDVPMESLSMNQVLELMDEAKTRMNLVFLDACRNNPYARSFRSAADGLAKVNAPSGTLISFATRPGSVAADGSGKNGLYTQHLLANMDSPQPVEQVLKRVVSGVKQASKGRQEPWMEGSIEGDFYFRPGEATQVTSLKPEPVRVQSAEEIEQEFWNRSKDSTDAEDFDAYLNQYPQGRYAALASAAIKRIKRQAQPVPAGSGEMIQGCTDCPEMVTIPGKNYEMGKYEVTQAQWEAVMGSNPSRFKGANQPVERVSWNDVQEYIKKLNQKTGKQYRLPTEAEWEYACYGGSQTEYCGGNNIDLVSWHSEFFSGNSGGKTHPVGQKQANGYGLYDMSGNVWEWMENCYDGNCDNGRVIRGGSWDNCFPQGVRAASRSTAAETNRGNDLNNGSYGFRLARTLP